MSEYYKYYMLLGSNLGDKEGVILRAVEELSKFALKSPRRSAFYVTEPWGFESEELFYNMALELESNLSPSDMISAIGKIEERLGRVRVGKGYSSRIIDIDILFCDDKIVETPELTIPHPRVHLRNFALIPLAELNGELLHPRLGLTINELIKECQDKLLVKKVS